VRKFRVAIVLAAVLSLGLIGGTAATAVLTSATGGDNDRQFFLSENAAWSTTNAIYTNIPGATRAFNVPFGRPRMVDVRFTAESACDGTVGWCTVRAILVYPGGAQLELNPVSGTDFAFDTADAATDDTWESHAIERSSRWLSAGRYRVVIQARTVFGATSIRLDDWHLTIATVSP
jgi:hypothetical protein